LTIVDFIGVASGVGAQDHGCEAGPEVLHTTCIKSHLCNNHVKWLTTLYPAQTQDDLHTIQLLCRGLAEQVQRSIEAPHRFAVFSGDHSSAIGTWSGARSALNEHDGLGLIWVDAHMDSHTPETSPSGAYHGMPLACLLGRGPVELTELSQHAPVLLPQNVALVGVRSFEAGERALLSELGVHIYYIDEVRERGLAAVMQAAHVRVTQHSSRFGISIDLDAIDPGQAPGVGSPEKGGIHGDELIVALETVATDERLIGIEVSEYNPSHDVEQKTAGLALALASTIVR